MIITDTTETDHHQLIALQLQQLEQQYHNRTVKLPQQDHLENTQIPQYHLWNQAVLLY